MKNIRKKLKSTAGESLAEVLIALLISALALVMLAEMINASANMIMRSRKTMEDYYTETPAQVNGYITLALSPADGEVTAENRKVSINQYTLHVGENKEVVYYEPATEGG